MSLGLARGPDFQRITKGTPGDEVASGHNLLYMRSDVSKEMSRFRLPSSGRRRLLLKVPNVSIATNVPSIEFPQYLLSFQAEYVILSREIFIFRGLTAI